MVAVVFTGKREDSLSTLRVQVEHLSKYFGVFEYPWSHVYMITGVGRGMGDLSTASYTDSSYIHGSV